MMGKVLETPVEVLNLVTAMIEGPFDAPLWSGFLETLRRATAADFTMLILHPPGPPMDDGLILTSNGPQAAQVADLFRACFYFQDPARRETVREGIPHGLDDLLHPSRGRQENPAHRLVETFGISGSRYIRVSEPRGVDGWLVIARRGGDFSEHDAELLATLAPPLRSVLRVYVAGERDRFRAAMAAEAVRRLQCGWFLLDQRGNILAADSFGEALLVGSGVLGRDKRGRLTLRPIELEREVLGNVAKLASNRSARPRAISLRVDPWLDMLLVPARKRVISDTAVPSVIAYVHSDNWRSADRCEQLSDLFELTPSEARLALGLCRGKSIAEAAAELGLTLETARSYSKSIYAKTGTRGMVDLVRIVMGSILTMAPDD